MIAVGTDGRISAVNPRAEAMLSLKDAVGRPAREALHADLADSIERAAGSKGAGPVRSIVIGEQTMVVAPTASGAVVVVMPSGIPSHLGHELKTPLTSIKAYTEAIDMMAEDEQQKQFLKVILDETDRMIAMIDAEVKRWRAGT